MSTTTLEEVWALFKETDRKIQETSEQMKETDRKFQETDRKFQETDRKFQENAEQLKETRRLLEKYSQEASQKIGELGNRLGQFVEGLIKPSVVQLFQQRGMAVHKVIGDVEVNNPELGLAMQIDLLVINSGSCVLIEVKSLLSQEDVDEHLERMEKFKPLFPEYQDRQVFGAVAGMVMAEHIAKYAYRKGFFVIAQKGEHAVLLNDEKFKPAVW